MELIAEYGITEETMVMPILSSIGYGGAGD